MIACLPDLGRRTLVMGILNVTPDSFSDGGLYAARDAALAHADELIAEGADIIDVGGESTRPGHAAVSEAEEIARIAPVIAALADRVSVPISIDTYKAATARVALNLGAKMINDVWGLQREPEIAQVAAEFGAPVVIMHNRAEIDASLDIIEDMKRFFARSIAIARAAGIPDDQIILDPGIGFGKSFAQGLDALRRLAEVKALGYPLLVGASRKSFIGRLLASQPLQEAAFAAVPVPPQDRLMGTLASHILAMAGGADIIRVHDVRAHVEAARVADAIIGKPITTVLPEKASIANARRLCGSPSNALGPDPE
jgi:dihydropteroate synthase